METSLAVAEIDEILRTRGDPPLNLHEFKELDRTMQTIWGRPTNNIAKPPELNKQISIDKRKFNTQNIHEFTTVRIAERL